MGRRLAVAWAMVLLAVVHAGAQVAGDERVWLMTWDDAGYHMRVLDRSGAEVAFVTEPTLLHPRYTRTQSMVIAPLPEAGTVAAVTGMMTCPAS